jgi:hypothetical protein
MTQIPDACQIDRVLPALEKVICSIKSCRHPYQLTVANRLVSSFIAHFTWAGNSLDPINRIHWAWLLAFCQRILNRELEHQRKILLPTIVVETEPLI